MKKFDNEAYGKLRNIQNLRISPDGGHTLYTIQTMDVKKDAYQTCLWVMDLSSGEERQLTAGEHDNGGFWLDDHTVAFSGVRGEPSEEESVLYRIDIRGGEALPFLRVPKAGAQITKIDGSRYLVRANTDVNAEEEKENANWRFFDEYPYMGDGAGYVNKSRRSLFLWDEEAKELKQLTPPLMQTYIPFFSDDVVLAEDGFYFVGYEYDRDAAGMACICKYEWETGEVKTLCEDRCYVFSLSRIDGRIYYAAWAVEEGPAVAAVRVKSVSEAGGDMRTDADPDWDLGTVRQREGQTLAILTSRACPQMSRWMGGTDFEAVPTPGICPNCAYPVGEDIVFSGWEENRLPEIYRLHDGEVTRLSHQNDALYAEYTFSTPEYMSVMDGKDEIVGWVMKPADYEEGKRYPGILNIHGGPHGYYNAAFVQEHQRWTSEGYFVFFCNPRGSTTFGRDFMNVTGRMGKEDYHNLMAFTDAVLKAFPALDGDRLAVTGQSYGGYMTNWIIGQTDRFKAAAPRMSISNWLSMHGTSDERWYGDFVCAGTPWKDAETAWEQSPLRYADAVKTPTLFIQHERDQRCPLEQAQQMFLALLERGVPAKMMVNLGCFHGGRKVSQLLHDIDVMMAWFAEYLGTEKTED